MFQGLLKKRCFNSVTGIEHYEPDQVCGRIDCDTGYFCGKGLANPNYNYTNFDTIFYSFLMVFQSVTLEGWTEIEFWLFDAFSIFIVIYFILIIFIGSFFLVNLTLAVIKAKFTDQENSSDNAVVEVVEEADMMDQIGESNNIEEYVELDEDEFIPDVETVKKYRKRFRVMYSTGESTNFTAGSK